MKKLIIFILVVTSTSSFAKIWRVNNNSGVVADFTTAQAAHNGALAGDTLMFEPSATSYGTLTVTKKLVIFGVGYFHALSNPNSPITTVSTLGNTIFNAGSSGSLIAGITGGSTLEVNTSNVTVRAVKDFTIRPENASSVVITKSYDINIILEGTCSNILINNNYLNGLNVSAAHTGVIVSNNVFKGTLTCVGQTFSNNIWFNSSCCTTATLTSSTVSNNIDARLPASQGFGTSNGNSGNAAPDLVFAGGTIGVNTFTPTYDGDLKLKTGSPAIAAGVGGVDCGMYGGASPYKLSGLPPIPLLTKFVSTGIGSDTTPIEITISAGSNN